MGIEEQFYLVFPIIAIVAFKYFRQHFFTILMGLSLLSLQFAELMEVRNSNLNFYLPFSRFCELAVGSMLAYRELNYETSNDGIGTRMLPMVGLCLIASSILFFDGTTPHPSFYTLLPILGVAMIIGFSSKDELVGKVLGSKPFVWIGLLSYSAYLWHFPIFAFARINSGEPQIYDKFWLIAATFVLSVISYRLVEKPIRNGVIVGKQMFLLVLLVFTSTTVMFATSVIVKEGFPGRYISGWANFELDDGVLRQGFWRYFELNKLSLKAPSAKKVNVYIFGNSHSGDFLGALFSQTDAYKNYHFLKTVRNEQLSCFDERDHRFAKMRSALYDSKAYEASDVFVIATRFFDSQCDKRLKDNPTDADGLSYLIPKLNKDGKKIILLGNTLTLDRTEGFWVAEKTYVDAVTNKIDFRSFDLFEKYKASAERKAYEIQNKLNLETNDRLKRFSVNNQLTYFERRSLFCDDAHRQCMVFDDHGFRLRYDHAHLTLKGKIVFGELLRKAKFDEILARAAADKSPPLPKFVAYEGTSKVSSR